MWKVNSELSHGGVPSGILSVADSTSIYIRFSVDIELLSTLQLPHKLYDHCNKTKETTKEKLGKWGAECEASRDNLKTAADRNAEQEQFIEVLKQELADLKIKAAKKDDAIEKMEKINKSKAN